MAPQEARRSKLSMQAKSKWTGQHAWRSRSSGSKPSVHHTLVLLPATPYVSGFFVCHVCWERGSGPQYHCPDCQLDIHVACAGTGSHETHFSHFAHPLQASGSSSAVAAATDALCDGCGDVRTANANGNGQHAENYYRCGRCDFDLCPLCTRAPRFLLHPSHPHVLALSPPAPDESMGTCRCDGCGGAATGMGMMYRCTACNFDLHEACVRLPLKPLHRPDHPLTLHFDNSAHAMSSCDACGHAIAKGHGDTTMSWVYTCNICRIFLHPMCARIQHHLPPLRSPTPARHAIQPASVVNRAATILNSRIANWPLSTRHHELVHSRSPRNDMSPYNLYDDHEDSIYDRSGVAIGAISPYPGYNNAAMPPIMPSRYIDPNHSNTRHRHDYMSTNLSSNSNTSLAQALATKLSPVVSSRDREAMERVLALLRHNASHSYDQL